MEFENTAAAEGEPAPNLFPFLEISLVIFFVTFLRTDACCISKFSLINLFSYPF
jgi:hypothetical protein